MNAQKFISQLHVFVAVDQETGEEGVILTEEGKPLIGWTAEQTLRAEVQARQIANTHRVHVVHVVFRDREILPMS
jgi:hypothetical protein